MYKKTMRPFNKIYTTSEEEENFYLTSVVTLFSSGTEAAGGKNKNLLCHAVDLPYTLVVVNDRNTSLSNT